MAKKTKKKNMTIAQLKEYMYKGSGKDPAVNKLIEKLKKDGGGSLDSSGFGDRWKVVTDRILKGEDGVTVQDMLFDYIKKKPTRSMKVRK